RYPYMPRLRDKNVLVDAVRDALYDAAFATQGFALATSYDENTGKFDGLALPVDDTEFGTITDDTLLVKPDLAVEQRRIEESAAAENTGDDGALSTHPGGAPSTGSGSRGGVPTTPPAPPESRVVENARYTARASVDAGADLGEQVRNIVDEVLVHLQ